MSDEDEPEGAADEPERSDGERKRRFEGALSGMLKRAVERAVETGVGRLAEGPEKLGHFVGEMKLPKEVLSYLYTQIDETKTGLYRVVAKEIRDVLEHTELADVLTKTLTKLSFEIRTEIRFVPNEAAPKAPAEGESPEGAANPSQPPPQQGLPKPEVTAHVSVKDRSKDKPKQR
ncbi:MAG: hypothetical protein IPK82_32145 [Polyangiaceae bacterium]|nr:hypothetical protein [Polyangiaceae bacterium]